MIPKVTPKLRKTTSASKVATSEGLMLYRSWLSRSRPSVSEPSQCMFDGPLSTSRRSCLPSG